MLRPDLRVGEKSSPKHSLDSDTEYRLVDEPERNKVFPIIKAVHEIKKDDYSMKVMDHNYYVQEMWIDDDIKDETFVRMIYKRILNILH